MKIIDVGPQFWFLLQGEGGYYLSVRCQQSFAEFELLLLLNADESREYHALGHVYIDDLATRVNDWSSQYLSRNESKQWRPLVNQAVADWKASHPNESL